MRWEERTNSAERTNCKNCGAPLHRHVCDYCGTEYRPLLGFSPVLYAHTTVAYCSGGMWQEVGPAHAATR